MTKMETGEAKNKEKSTKSFAKRESDNSLRPMSCSECLNIILDKYYIKVDGKVLHEKCIRCSSCCQHLADSCFSKNSKLYCKQCYERLQSCTNCSKIIAGEDLVMRIGTDLYHVTCFSCSSCERILKTGDKFRSLQHCLSSKIFCENCFEINETDSEGSSTCTETGKGHTLFYDHTSFYKRQFSDFSPHDILVNKASFTSSITSKLKSLKRPRTILTKIQRKKFKASFAISQKPCRKVREVLANETGLSPRVVQVWFQNQRAKMRKISRRQSQEPESSEKEDAKHDSDTENEIVTSPIYCSFTQAPHQTQCQNEYSFLPQSTMSWDQAPASTKFSSSKQDQIAATDHTSSTVDAKSSESGEIIQPTTGVRSFFPSYHYEDISENVAKTFFTQEDLISYNVEPVNNNWVYDVTSTFSDILPVTDASSTSSIDSLMLTEDNCFAK